MAKFIYETRNSVMIMAVLAVVMLLILLPLLSRAVPLLASSCNLVVSTFHYLWILIKRRPFIYIILNFIIISLLGSSSFCPQLNLLLLKFQPKPKVPNMERTTSHVIPFFGDDDMWWIGIIDGEEAIAAATWKAEEHHDEEEVKDDMAVEREVVEEEYKGEEDTLDGTWKAIMEAKSKGGGPQLKKSGTWSSGDRGGGHDGDVGGGGGGGGLNAGKKGKAGRIEGYRSDLKRWRTFAEAGGEDEENGDSSVGGGGEGWRKVEVALTYHDELKKRADAFIAQFVHRMRLQRLESDQRFMEMINRGH